VIEAFKNNPDVLEAYNHWKSIQQSPKQEFTGLYNKKVYQPPVQNGKPFIFDDYMNGIEQEHFDNIQNAIEQSYANKADAIQNFRKNYYLPELNNNDVYKADELLHLLTARETSNPGAAVLKAYRQFQALPAGKEAIPAHSLSSNSKPLSLGVARLAQRQGTLGDVRYYGLNELNTMGFPTKAGIPAEVVSTDINNLIHELNANLPAGKKIPYSNTAMDWTGSSTTVNYPKITYVRKKNGGWINKYK
jgi:hypothetical protein